MKIGQKEINDYYRKLPPLTKKINTFTHKIYSKSNNLLQNSTKMRRVNSDRYSIDLKNTLSKNTLEEIKKKEYESKWGFASYFGKNKSLSQCLRKGTKTKSTIRIINKVNYRSPLFRMSRKEDLNLEMSPDQSPKRVKSVAQFLKECQEIKGKNDKFYNYINKLNDFVGEYIHHNDNFDSVYDIGNQVLRDIKKEKIGIEIPGNFTGYNSEAGKFQFVRSMYPACINIKSKHTDMLCASKQLPKPRGYAGKYPIITYNELYGDFQK